MSEAIRQVLGADGASYLVWDDARSGNANIYFFKRAAGTGLWGVNLTVNDDSTGNPAQRIPRIADQR